MKVTEVPSRITEVLSDKFGHPERSSGLHVSQIIRDLSLAVGKKKGGGNGISTDQLEEFGTIGFLWERVLEHTLATLVADSDPGRYLRVGEQHSPEGIFLTTDYVDLDFFGDGTYHLGLEEWKCNWSSYRKADDLQIHFWHWIVQMKSYCRVLNTRLARLRILFIAGDWKGDITPRLRTFEFEFTERELDDNWEMLVGHARRKGWL